MRSSIRSHIAIAAFWSLVLVCAAGAQPAGKPVSKDGLKKALSIGGLTTQEFVDIVESRGVDFRLTPAIEDELKQAGAAPALIEAIRKNYRGEAPAPAPAKQPLAQSEILTLLQVGTSSPVVEQLVRQRGVSFQPTAQTTQQLVLAGASASLVNAIREVSGVPAEGGGRRPGRMLPLSEVKRVFVEEMPEDLDSHLRREIGAQLAGHMAVVLDRGQADAILVGEAERSGGGVGTALGLGDKARAEVRLMDPSLTAIIWSGDAGDRSALGAFRKGGPAKVAERLVKQLKKSVEGRD